MLNHKLQTAKELAIRAGPILLEHYKESPSVQWKGEGDPVTSADRAASRFLTGELKQRFPEDGILCEEEQDDVSRLEKSRVWIVDPMDGTTEFVARCSRFAVMVCLGVGGAHGPGVGF